MNIKKHIIPIILYIIGIFFFGCNDIDNKYIKIINPSNNTQILSTFNIEVNSNINSKLKYSIEYKYGGIIFDTVSNSHQITVNHLSEKITLEPFFKVKLVLKVRKLDNISISDSVHFLVY